MEGRRWKCRDTVHGDYKHRIDDDELIQEFDDVVRNIHKSGTLVEKIIVQLSDKDIVYTAEMPEREEES